MIRYLYPWCNVDIILAGSGDLGFILDCEYQYLRCYLDSHEGLTSQYLLVTQLQGSKGEKASNYLLKAQSGVYFHIQLPKAFNA
jgi:hypothetical protein